MGVHPYQPGLYLSCDTVGARQVLCPDTRAETILTGICQIDTLSLVLECDVPYVSDAVKSVREEGNVR